MTGLEITLFFLGTAFIIISFFIVDNNDKKQAAAVSAVPDREAVEQLRKDFADKSAMEADILLHETEDKLEQVSNDKIIAVGEYSDQVLEKINSNHKEVVFLYQMLNEKEEELKATVTKMDNMRIECEKLLRSQAVPSGESGNAKEPAVQEHVPVRTSQPEAKPVRPSEPKAAGNAGAGTAPSTPARTRTAAARTAKAPEKSRSAAKPETRTPAPAAKSPAVSANLDSGSLNRNDEIISLYKSGKSIMEISKLLGMGQGEVKLIIDLYC